VVVWLLLLNGWLGWNERGEGGDRAILEVGERQVWGGMVFLFSVFVSFVDGLHSLGTQ